MADPMHQDCLTRVVVIDELACDVMHLNEAMARIAAALEGWPPSERSYVCRALLQAALTRSAASGADSLGRPI